MILEWRSTLYFYQKTGNNVDLEILLVNITEGIMKTYSLYLLFEKGSDW